MRDQFLENLNLSCLVMTNAKPYLCKFGVCEPENVMVPTPPYSLPEIELDSVRQEARLPSEKIHKCPSIFAEKISHVGRTTVVNWPIKILLFRGHSRPTICDASILPQALHTPPPPPSHSPFKHLR